MWKEKEIWYAVIFGTVLLLALGGVIISFVFLHQRKKYRHKQEVMQIQETFTQEMLHSKAEIQEQTLQHIATELHDNFTPTLSVININLAGVASQTENPVKEKITDTKALVKQLMAEMRALSISLNTDQISKIGFSRALQQQIDNLRKSGFYAITFNEEGDAFRLSPHKEIILLRMCQVVFNNIVKHAEAKSIRVRLMYEARVLKVEIVDDGKGFDVESIANHPQKQDSSGLRNLQKRALALNATLSIKSQPGQGTHILISTPI